MVNVRARSAHVPQLHEMRQYNQEVLQSTVRCARSMHHGIVIAPGGNVGDSKPHRGQPYAI